MKTVGIKLADGTFYPVMEEGKAQEKQLELTTAHNNQTCVMVDMYRSKTGTMEDAEYIDTLKIENLVAHPNGEPNITFSVGLDENNELKANIIDKETGAESNSTITLVSRTIEERLQPDSYSISYSNNNTESEIDNVEITEEPSDSENSGKGAVVAGAIAGGGLLAAAAAIRKREQSKNIEKEENVVVENTPEEPAVAPEMEEEVQNETAVDLPDFSEEEISDNSDNYEDEFTLGNPAFNPIDSDETIVSDDFNLDDSENTDSIAAEPMDLPDFDIPEDSTLDNSDFSDSIIDSTDTIEDTAFDDSFETADNTQVDNSLETSETVEEENFGIPEMSFDDIQDSFEENNSLADDQFEIPDFDETELSDTSLEDDLFNDTNDNSDFSGMSAGSGLSFTGLYDKETAMGEAGKYEEDSKKKTRTPMIICIICAIICLLTTLLILFIIPSKYNLISKHAEKEVVVVEKTVEVEKAAEPQEKTINVVVKEAAEQSEEPKKTEADSNNKAESPSEKEEISQPVQEEYEEETVDSNEAKEDEIVIIPEAETVIPLPPPVVEVKPEIVTYKIKWGDTLWDIAESFYKDPWHYKFIAAWNRIRNPDYIISGTIIELPED